MRTLFLAETVSSKIEQHGRARVREHRRQKNMLCLKFDGRKDLTLPLDRQLIWEGYVVVIEEPGAKYVDHITPNSCSAKAIKKKLQDLISENGSDQSVQVIGADSTSVNTGRRGGVIRCLELHLQCPLQSNICLLHLNELPLRHLFTSFDGLQDQELLLVLLERSWKNSPVNPLPTLPLFLGEFSPSVLL